MNNKGRIDSPIIKRQIRDEILFIKSSEPGVTAKQIQNKLKKLHPTSKYIPKIRAIQKRIHDNEDLLKNFEPSELDKPFTIGCCEAYDIPSEIIPVLMEWEPTENEKLTIREARWAAKLYAVARKFLYPSHIKDKGYAYQMFLVNFSAVTSMYAYTERLAELKGDEYPDTTILDNTHFKKPEYKDSLFLKLSKDGESE